MMHGYLDSIRQQGFRQGFQLGCQLGCQLGLQVAYQNNYQRERIESCAFVVQHRMDKASCTPQEAMDYLGVKGETERAAILAILERNGVAAPVPPEKQPIQKEETQQHEDSY